MEYSRNKRVAEEIKKTASEIINNELKDPRIEGLISVTRVFVSKDLRNAKIFLSIYGTELAKARTLEGIKSAEGFIRRRIANKIYLRYVPELTFKLDESIEYGVHISKILQDVEKPDGNEE